MVRRKEEIRGEAEALVEAGGPQPDRQPIAGHDAGAPDADVVTLGEITTNRLAEGERVGLIGDERGCDRPRRVGTRGDTVEERAPDVAQLRLFRRAPPRVGEGLL